MKINRLFPLKPAYEHEMVVGGARSTRNTSTPEKNVPQGNEPNLATKCLLGVNNQSSHSDTVVPPIRCFANKVIPHRTKKKRVRKQYRRVVSLKQNLEKPPKEGKANLQMIPPNPNESTYESYQNPPLAIPHVVVYVL